VILSDLIAMTSILILSFILGSLLLRCCHDQVPYFLMQDLSLDEEAAIPTCNLSETVHNTWKQASSSNSSDLYNTTLDDYYRAAFQSTTNHNYLKAAGVGLGLIVQF
jgi:hypothetical protein